MNCNHVKLDDVPDMNYFSVNNEGEVGRLHPVIMSRQSWWRRFYQKGPTIVRAGLGLTPLRSLAEDRTSLGLTFLVPTMGI